MELPLKGQKVVEGPIMSMIKSVMPIFVWLPNYPWRGFLLSDLAGALTLGCVLMGQSLAHADLCQVKLIHGPYSCIMPPLMYSIFGTCIHASVGTGGLVSLLTGEQLAKFSDDIDERSHAGAIMTLEVGLILAVMGVCRLAFLVRFLSRPALSGFITASAILIILSQLAPMIGLPTWASKGGIVEIVVLHTRNLELLNIVTSLLSFCTFMFLSQAKRLKQFRALRFLSDFKELFTLLVTCIFAKHFNASLGEDGRKIKIVGPMPSGLPSFSLPVGPGDFGVMMDLLPSAALVAIVTFLSSFAGAKKFAMKDGYQIKAFNELLALGAANGIGSLNGAVPTQIGLSRMGIAHECGISSQMGANVFVGIVVASITAVFSGYLYHVPKCVLNCIIVNGATHLSEFAEGKKLWDLTKDSRYAWKSRMEFLVWGVGFACTLYFGAFLGMVVAVVVSLLLILYQVVNPEITELGFRPDSLEDETLRRVGKCDRPRKWINITNESARKEADILVCRLEGPLFYANVESFQEWLEEQEIAHEEATGGSTYKGIILSAAAIPFMDTTAVSTLQEIVKTTSERNILFFCANTFGTTGRLITHRLEEQMSKKLRTDRLREQLRQCSSVDDFVQLIHAHHSPIRLNLSRTRFCRDASCEFSTRSIEYAGDGTKGG